MSEETIRVRHTLKVYENGQKAFSFRGCSPTDPIRPQTLVIGSRSALAMVRPLWQILDLPLVPLTTSYSLLLVHTIRYD